MLCQEIFGINDYVREVADLYAEEGYVVLAPDLFWRMEPGVDLGYSPEDWQRAFGFFQKFDIDAGVADVTASVKALRAHPACTGKVGALGFCLGGKLAYLAAAHSGVDAAVGYYGVGIEGALDLRAENRVPDRPALRGARPVLPARGPGPGARSLRRQGRCADVCVPRRRPCVCAHRR